VFAVLLKFLVERATIPAQSNHNVGVSLLAKLNGESVIVERHDPAHKTRIGRERLLTHAAIRHCDIRVFAVVESSYQQPHRKIPLTA
jgi:hypothetical protein